MIWATNTGAIAALGEPRGQRMPKVVNIEIRQVSFFQRFRPASTRSFIGFERRLRIREYVRIGFPPERVRQRNSLLFGLAEMGDPTFSSDRFRFPHADYVVYKVDIAPKQLISSYDVTAFQFRESKRPMHECEAQQPRAVALPHDTVEYGCRRRRCLRSSRNSTSLSENRLSLISLLRSANFSIRRSTANTRFTVAVPTPLDRRNSLKSSIRSPVMSESLGSPKPRGQVSNSMSCIA